MISVAIPTWNRSRYLRESVLAALAQTRPLDEIVVSDDCSPDDTLDVLATLTAQYPTVRVVRQPTNTGGVPNWNAAIDATRGDLIALVTDDDMIRPAHLETCERWLEDHPETGMVHGGFDTLLDHGDGRTETLLQPHLRRPSLHGASGVLYMCRYYCWPFHAATLVFRREVWEQVGRFDPRYRLADTGWFLRVAGRYRVDFLPGGHVLNRRHPGNWSNAVGSVGMHDEVNRMVLEYVDALEVPRVQREVLRQLWLANHRLRCSRVAVARARAGSAEAATGALRLLLETLPGGRRVSSRALDRAGRTMTGVLHWLQAYLPGGHEKYGDLGRTVPR